MAREVGDAQKGRPSGKVRAARLTDLAALGDLSRIAQTDGSGSRTLGLPVNGPPIGVFSLFRLPLVAFRPHDLLFVYESDRHVAGLVRVERENWRDDWTIVELDAIGGAPGEIRYRLVQQILREGQKRGAARFHVACADADDNIELFMQAGFVRYGEERVLYRPPDQPLPAPWTDERAAEARIRQARPIDAIALMQLYAAVTPAPVQRLEAFRIPDCARARTGGCREARSRRSSASRTSTASFRNRPTVPGSTRSSRPAWRARTSRTTSGPSADPRRTFVR